MIELINNEYRCNECESEVGIEGVSYWECDICNKEYCEDCYLPNVNDCAQWICSDCEGKHDI